MAIHIKKSHKGLLHKNLGVPAGKKIPASKLKIKSTDSEAVRKRKQFAINAKKFKHEDGGKVAEMGCGGKMKKAGDGIKVLPAERFGITRKSEFGGKIKPKKFTIKKK